MTSVRSVAYLTGADPRLFPQRVRVIGRPARAPRWRLALHSAGALAGLVLFVLGACLAGIAVVH
jgi:hypothetical protein